MQITTSVVCNSGNECTSGWCDWNTGECTALKADGQPCDYGWDCESGYCNNDDVCEGAQTQDVDFDICKPE